MKNPFQKKYLPVLICLALGVACTAVVGVSAVTFSFAILAAFNWFTADQPLSVFYTHAYSTCAAICLAIGIFALFSHTWPLVISGFATACLPLSIVFTRKGPS